MVTMTEPILRTDHLSQSIEKLHFTFEQLLSMLYLCDWQIRRYIMFTVIVMPSGQKRFITEVDIDADIISCDLC